MDSGKFTDFISPKDISVTGGFWKQVTELVRTKVIPYQWEVLNDRIPGAEPSYCMRNFKIAAQLTHSGLDYGVDSALGHGGFFFQDTDFSKWLEALSYTLMWHQDVNLEKLADEAIDIVCSAQQSDGYLDTYYIITGLDKRFTNLMDHHELYCLGHMIEGAVAYFLATGKRKLLDAVIRFVDCVDSHIGPEEGKKHGYPGCETAELALVKLYNVTKNEKHLKLAKYFVDRRGQSPLYFEEEMKKYGNTCYWLDGHLKFQYYQAGKPVRDQHSAEGHAVRGPYLYSGMADLARITGDDGLLQACNNIWDDIVNRQMYINGAIGQSEYGESFTFDYDLPNDTIYAETCAAISLAFFAKRLAEISPRGIYGDIIEKTFFNSVLSGMSLDGQHFFYVNPLEVLPEAVEKSRIYKHVKIQRPKWLGCACCPPNVARTFASLGSYVYSTGSNAIYVHLYLSNDAKINLGAEEVGIAMKTGYPWEGGISVSFNLSKPLKFDYALRIPGWCKKYSIAVNGAAVPYAEQDGFAVISREWKDGDTVNLNLDMPVTLAGANPRVRQDIGKTAVMRGPLVYCLEEKDNGKGLYRVFIKPGTEFTSGYEKDLLGGVVTLSSKGERLADWKGGSLYSYGEAGGSAEDRFEEVKLKWIPYYAWANRGPGEMLVWVHKHD